MDKSENFLTTWGKKIDWNKRVSSVCKPCWELKYCPYGSLVEDFPIQSERDEKSCRIFGHDCPVFYVAEPFTETKEIRKISRTIPRTIQFKVLKRENQICRICGNSVLDENIHFDHIIPWSKGGATEEHNIRLLCSSCNQKRSNNYEDEYLVKDFKELLGEPYDVDIIDFFTTVINYGHEHKKFKNENPMAKDFAERFSAGNISVFEEHIATIYSELAVFFNSKKPTELNQNEFELLKERWGFIDFKVYYLEDICKVHGIAIERGVEIEKSLFKRIGIRIKEGKTNLKKWAKY